MPKIVSATVCSNKFCEISKSRDIRIMKKISVKKIGFKQKARAQVSKTVQKNKIVKSKLMEHLVFEKKMRLFLSFSNTVMIILS